MVLTDSSSDEYRCLCYEQSYADWPDKDYAAHELCRVDAVILLASELFELWSYLLLESLSWKC